MKMVHNGIEYGDMQLIAESYDLMQHLLGLSAQDMAEIFTEWNKGELDSYLIEITADILGRKDDEGQDGPIVDYILDAAGIHEIEFEFYKYMKFHSHSMKDPIYTKNITMDCLPVLQHCRQHQAGSPL